MLIKAESPCIKLCNINKQTKRCDGCDRTIEEIIAAGLAKSKPV